MGFIDFGIDGEDAARGLGFGNDGITQMVLSRNGNLGIGTTTPVTDIDIIAPNNQAADISLRNEDTGAAMVLRTDGGGNSFISNRNGFVGNGSTNNNNLVLNGQIEW